MKPLTVISILIFLCVNLERNAVAQSNDNNISTTTKSVVGMITRSFADEARKNWEGTGPRPLKTVIWYPSEAGSKEDTASDPNHFFKSYVVAPSAKMSRESLSYPLILLSHGAASEASAMMWLGTYLASHGYIVAAVNHHGCTSAEKEILPQGLFLPWERANDLSVVLDKMLSDSVFGPLIDKNRIGAAGYSAGGFAVISIAGGVYSLKALQNFCNSPRRNPSYCDPPPEIQKLLAKLQELAKTDSVVSVSMRHAGDSYKDERIKGIFAIAPALGPAFTDSTLATISIPVQIVGGSADVIAPPSADAQWYASNIKGARLLMLPGNVGHFTFGSECTLTGKNSLWICRDAEGVDRVAIHSQVNNLAINFFDQILKLK